MSGIFATFNIVEDISMYGLDSSVLFFYSYCGTTPFYPGVKNKSIIFLVYGIFGIVSLVSEMGCHVTILFRQTRIETRSNLYVLKDNKVVSSQRHHRNIVSALGHFATFIISMAQLFLLMNTFYFFIENEEVLVTIRTLNLFFIPAIEFFVYPLIETIFSERLHGTLSFMNFGS